MKFERDVVDKSSYHINIKTYTKKYFQSYLAWLYEQNTEFAVYLHAEELTNFFVQEIQHPLWFQLFLQYEPLAMLAEINQYMERYKQEAHLMKQELPILLQNPIEGTLPTACLKYKEANLKDAQYASHVALQEHLQVPASITEVDVLLLRELSKGGNTHVL